MSSSLLDKASTDEIIVLDGLGDAIVGIAERCTERVAVYDHDKIVSILASRDGMSEEEAVEYVEYNILGAWVGKGGPMILVDKAEADIGALLRAENERLSQEVERLKSELVSVIGAKDDA